MKNRTLKDIWENGDRRHSTLSSRNLISRIPVWIRLACLIPTVLVAFAVTGSYIADNLPFLIAVGLIWVAGSTWVLAGVATESGGWNEFQISTFFLLPLLTACIILTPICALALWGLGRMH